MGPRPHPHDDDYNYGGKNLDHESHKLELHPLKEKKKTSVFAKSAYSDQKNT